MVIINKYVIIGKRWFDRVNGNTYHTVNIINTASNESIYTSNCMVYGYGDQWKHTAYDSLILLKLATEKDRFNHDLNSKRFIYICSDVTRKKDLF